MNPITNIIIKDGVLYAVVKLPPIIPFNMDFDGIEINYDLDIIYKNGYKIYR